MAFKKEADSGFDVVTAIALVIFGSEIILASISKPDYLLGFFFFLDLISTLSLILDLQFINNALFFNKRAASAASIARAGRASRIGTRAGRVVRLVRLVRIVKLYKATAKDDEELEEKKLFLEKLKEKQLKKLQ